MIRILVIAFIAAAALVHAQERNPNDWPAYLADPASSQFSPLTQITPENVTRLEKVWQYRSEDGKQEGQIQCNPLIIDGVLYGASPRLKAFALNAATGEELWKFDPLQGKSASGVVRGLVYWADGDDKRIHYCAQHYIYALNAETGKPIETFGEDGRVNLKEGLGRDASKLFVGANTPGVVYNDLLIQGTRINEAHPAAPGHVRAFDIRTGEQRWIFHTIPKPGEFGSETWPPNAWNQFGAANSWAGMSVDTFRGIVYVPTGSAAYDFYGADRPGDNLFANTLLALDAETGERIWHYQIVRHDLWDRDLPAPPNLIVVNHDSQRIEAVAQITKSAHVFLFDRDTGEPLFEIERVEVPASDLPGEQTARWQPIPVKPPTFTRETLTLDDVSSISPEANAFATETLKSVRFGQQFIPPSREGTVVLPGFDGGGEWGGAASDPETGMIYVNGSNLPWILTMVPRKGVEIVEGSGEGRALYEAHCMECHGQDREGNAGEEYPSLINVKDRTTRLVSKLLIQNGIDRMPAFGFLTEDEIDSLIDYILDEEESGPTIKAPEPKNGQLKSDFKSTGYNRFLDEDGYPAIKPPWGVLNAIDMNTGEIVWKSVLGEYPELTARGIPKTGTENYGGPALTAGGLIFIAATQDAKIRAFDAKTGEELWVGDLPAGGYATPSVYAVDGRQFVVIAAGGGKMGTPASDHYIAFALPE